MFVQHHSYMETAARGYVLHLEGGAVIVPKASAVVAYTPVTKYTSQFPGKEVYEKKDPADPTKLYNSDWDLTGARLINGQEGYDCLFVSNAMNGFYLLIGLGERDPYTRIAVQKRTYVPPRDKIPRKGEPRLPWNRSLKTKYLTPIEICNANGVTITNSYNGRTLMGARGWIPSRTNKSYTAIITPSVTVRDLHVIPNQEYVWPSPKLDTQTGTSTYATNIGAYWVKTDPTWEETVVPSALARDCPPPYNAIPIQSRIRYGYFQHANYGYRPRSSVIEAEKEFAYDQNLHLETSKNPYGYPVLLDTGTPYAEPYSGSWRRSVLWDRPIALLNIKTPALGANGNTGIQPAVAVPLMLYHYPYVDTSGKYHGPIDSDTGRRWAKGLTAITYVTDESLFAHYGALEQASIRMYQTTRPITKYPIYPDAKTNDGKEITLENAIKKVQDDRVKQTAAATN